MAGRRAQHWVQRFAAAVQGADGRIRGRQVETRALLLDGGYRLLVGQLAEDRAALRARYLSALFRSLLVTGALGGLLGSWFSRRGFAFVEEVSATGDKFLAGKIEERVPVSARRDEYDRLAATINACFVEIGLVVRSLRAATDGMAHDLKTPLRRIGARFEVAEMRGSDADALREAIGESRADLAALLRIIEEMLSLARAEDRRPRSLGVLSSQRIADTDGRSCRESRRKRSPTAPNAFTC